MSQDFMDPELFSDFIVEAKEHLETIEPNLLELEKTPDNLALLNEIFRPMHSLKGASGFLGLNRINRLAHKAENILDELRKGSMVITSEIMDVILAATDALRQMIDSLEATSTEGDVEIEPIYEQIDAIMRGESTAAAAPAEAAPAPEQSAAPDAPAPQAGAPEPSTAPRDAAGAPDRTASMTSSEWIMTLAVREGYSLTAFGEGHLKDFIDEASEITENLTSGLLSMERESENDPELVNDLFRYFHNLKGNSGIIGYHDLNSLTHEAETLLNRVRHNEMPASPELIDLLLLVVDVIESLVDRIDAANGTVQPFDISEVLGKLQQAVAGGAIELPAALMPQRKTAGRSAPAQAAPAGATPPDAASGDAAADKDDVAAFVATVRQQQSIVSAALDELGKDGSKKEYIDALYRSLVAMQNASGFMKLEEIKVYAERTAGLVSQGRSSDMDFGLMVDLLRQEVAIINDMLEKEIARLHDGVSAGGEGTPSSTGIVVLPVSSASPEAPASESEKSAGAAVAPAAPSTTAPAAPAAPTPATPPAPKPAAPAAPTEPAAPKPGAKAAPAASPAAPAARPAPAAAKPAAAAPAAGAEHKSSSTIRVDHEKLDHLMNLIGELIINRNRYTMLARRLEEPDAEKDIGEIAQNLSETTYAMARISDDLQDTIMKVRMVPVASVFSRFPRLVRDLSRKSGKEVELVLEGEETELDKSVVEVIGDPLVHLIRNAVDHGIEPESERVPKGKPAKGRVTLRAYHKGNSVAIEIEDDGKGLDPDKLREVAVRKGIMTAEEVKQLDDREARELIFAPGFSSAEKITDISGRGVGMDVVKKNVEAVGGTISITSELGKGRCTTLKIPLTMAITDGMEISVGKSMFTIPIANIRQSFKPQQEEVILDANGNEIIKCLDTFYPIVRIHELYNIETEITKIEDGILIWVETADKSYCLFVDELLGEQQVVVKPLSPFLGNFNIKNSGIGGCTILGDGNISLILDIGNLYAAYHTQY